MAPLLWYRIHINCNRKKSDCWRGMDTKNSIKKETSPWASSNLNCAGCASTSKTHKHEKAHKFTRKKDKWPFLMLLGRFFELKLHLLWYRININLMRKFAVRTSGHVLRQISITSFE